MIELAQSPGLTPSPWLTLPARTASPRPAGPRVTLLCFCQETRASPDALMCDGWNASENWSFAEEDPREWSCAVTFRQGFLLSLPCFGRAWPPCFLIGLMPCGSSEPCTMCIWNSLAFLFQSLNIRSGMELGRWWSLDPRSGRRVLRIGQLNLFFLHMCSIFKDISQ